MDNDIHNQKKRGKEKCKNVSNFSCKIEQGTLDDKVMNKKNEEHQEQECLSRFKIICMLYQHPDVKNQGTKK